LRVAIVELITPIELYLNLVHELSGVRSGVGYVLLHLSWRKRRRHDIEVA